MASDGLRRLLQRPAVRRLLLLIVISVVGWFGYRGLSQGAAADRCAEALIDAVTRRDGAWLGAHVRNPSLEETLTEAARVELLFVRPVSSEWSRIGLAVRDTATATRARGVYVLVANDEQASCTLLQDYDVPR